MIEENDRLERNAAIAEAATSWSPAYPGKKDVPRNIAKVCRAAMTTARNKQMAPIDCIDEACRINGMDRSDIDLYTREGE